jgi:hypothetical protein
MRDDIVDPTPAGNPEKKKKPKRLGLYKEGKSIIEKVVTETFKPDVKVEKKEIKVIEEIQPRGRIQSTSPKRNQVT